MSRLHTDYMSSEEYVKLEGSRCPRCFSDQIEGSSWEVDTTTATQDLICNSCGASWYEQYKLVGYDADRQEWMNEDTDV